MPLQTVILARILRLASSASTLRLRSPSTSASIIARPDTPETSETTTLSLIPASSKLFRPLLLRGPRSDQVVIRYAEARIMPSSRAGAGCGWWLAVKTSA